ncbi:hypothetical protein QAD02_007385 [Eretmocerus hayati]|uniref:Uncharacterized protein n=1 Tax=Eretmocerus hayati TaxID=131215 RepID=A0ACC2N3I3_9HYME|nr:hypothetical protein QAD02_007385 [Eretmocerus hayati]
MFYEKYDKAFMNPTLHKFLTHGSDIAEEFPLPVAYFSEDALECWHKILRRDKNAHARQCSRREDLFNRAMHLSDPLISLISLETSVEKEGHGITKNMVPFILGSDLEGIQIKERVELEDGEVSDDET